MALAQSLLEELQDQCCEQVVFESISDQDLENLPGLLEPLAMDHQVTVCVNASGLRVLGLRDRCGAACKELEALSQSLEEGLLRRNAQQAKEADASEERHGQVLMQIPPARDASQSSAKSTGSQEVPQQDLNIQQFVMGSSSRYACQAGCSLK